MNTARYLAKAKKRVLVIDLDLGAPGVDVFDVFDGPGKPSYNPSKFYYAQTRKSQWMSEAVAGCLPRSAVRFVSAQAPAGFVEFATAFLNAHGHAEKQPRLVYPGSIVDDWKASEPRYLFLLPKREVEEGDIVVMRAGKHDDWEQYQNALAKLDIKDLDPDVGQQSNGASGDEPEFIAYLKEQIRDVVQPDYVLIDARPGIEGISVLALRWLAECLVLCFNLNPWNLEGIIEAYERAKTWPSQLQSNILLLASPIPTSARNYNMYANQHHTIQTRMPRARNSGSGAEGGPIEVPHAEILLLRDILISDSEPTHQASLAYERTATLIIAGNPEDLHNRIRAATEGADPDQVDTSFQRLLRNYRQHEALFYEYGVHLLKTGREEDAITQFADAWRIIEAREQQEPKPPPSPYRRAAAFHYGQSQLAAARRLLARYHERAQGGDEGELARGLELIHASIHRGEQVVGHQKDDASLAKFFAQLGTLERLRADYLHVRHSDPLMRVEALDRAVQHYSQAIEMAEKDATYRHEMATVTGALAILKSTRDPSAGKALEEATLKAYTAAVELHGDFPEALLDWGRYLLGLAARVDDEIMPLPTETRPYFVWAKDGSSWPTSHVGASKPNEGQLREAEQKLRHAIRVRPGNAFSHFHLGLAKALQASAWSPVSKERFSALRDAISEMSLCNVYDPRYSPAYFFGALFQFLMQDVEEGRRDDLVAGKPARKHVRFRQAFYRLEHFIQLEIEAIVHDAPTGTREPFYFDPQDIETVQARRYEFLTALQHQMKFPSLIALFMDSPPSADSRAVRMLRGYLDRLRGKGGVR
jgi:tetratricopeptide (TPR) repeat protein